MADVNGKQLIRTLDLLGGDAAVKIGDGVETANVTSSNELNVLDTNSPAILADTSTIAGAVSGTEMQVDIVTMPEVVANIEGDYTDDSAFTVATDKGLAIGGVFTTDSVDAGDFGAFKMSANRELHIAQDTAADLNVTEASAAAILADTTGILADTANMDNNLGTVAGAVSGTEMQVDVLTTVGLTDTQLRATPVPVTFDVVTSSVEKDSYDTSSALAAAATSNHDVAVTASTTAKLRKIFASASDRLKIELLVGPVASLVSKGVWFNSPSNPNIEVDIAGLIEVDDASTGTIRIVRTNAHDAALDVYSTVLYEEIAD